MERLVMAGHGRRGGDWNGSVRRGRQGRVRLGMAGFGAAGVVGNGSGSVRRGRQGKVRKGQDRKGENGHARRDKENMIGGL